MSKRKHTLTPTTQVAETPKQPTTPTPEPAPASTMPESTAPVQEVPNARPDPIDAIRQRATKLAATPTKSSPKLCLCGCKGITKGGNFKPGHNGRLLQALLIEERAKIALQEPSTGTVQ